MKLYNMVKPIVSTFGYITLLNDGEPITRVVSLLQCEDLVVLAVYDMENEKTIKTNGDGEPLVKLLEVPLAKFKVENGAKEDITEAVLTHSEALYQHFHEAKDEPITI